MNKNYREKYVTIQNDPFPERFDITFHYEEGDYSTSYKKVLWETDNNTRAGLRYGENPHQKAALYTCDTSSKEMSAALPMEPLYGLTSNLELIKSGKHPGKINIMDVDRALQIIQYLSFKPSAVVMKHNIPSGAAKAGTQLEAIQKAMDADIVAAFGGTLVVNVPLTKESAQVIKDFYFENVAAPDFEEGALNILASKKNLRVFLVPGMQRLIESAGTTYLEVSSLIDGGLILQDSYTTSIKSISDLTPAQIEKNGKLYRSHIQASQKELEDLLFGWFVESGVISNSIIYVKDGATLAIGSGMQDRVGVATLARDKAYRNKAHLISKERYHKGYNELKDSEKNEVQEEVEILQGDLPGSVMVSDGFFPFRDGVEVGLKEGVRAVLEPGGSLRDDEVIEACNKYKAALLFTNERSFRH